jgi:hypothetical protein
MSSAFIDMAIGVGAPIVPVRFVGGLPVEPLAERIDFPVGYGRQDYWIGRPILPEELAALPYKDRRDRIVDAINGLGPALADETPMPGDPRFAGEVRNWMDRSGASESSSVLLATLRAGEKHASAEVRAILQAMTSDQLLVDDDTKGRWLATLAERLYGPNGPRVVVKASR